MGDKPNSDWPRTLENIEQSIARCLETLEQYESKFEKVLVNGSTNAVVQRLSFDGTAWNEKLAVAEAEVSRAEQLIVEQEAIWTRWQSALSEWQISVERLTAN